MNHEPRKNTEEHGSDPGPRKNREEHGLDPGPRKNTEEHGSDPGPRKNTEEHGSDPGSRPTDPEQGSSSGPILVGLILTFIGLAMLADRMGLSGIHLTGKWWPFVLIAFGLARLLAPSAPRKGQRRSRWTGIWLVYLGLWFFVNEFRVLGFWYNTSWPLLIVGAGIGMIWRAIEGTDRGSCQRVEGGQ
jgi:hypothetical protein